MKSLPKNIRIFGLIVVDVVAILACYLLALLLRFNFDIDVHNQYLELFINNSVAIVVIKLIVFYFFDLYKSLWEYASIDELIKIVIACLVANIAAISYFAFIHEHLPRSVYIGAFALDILFIGGIRLSYRMLRRVRKNTITFSNDSKTRRVLIVGAGDAGVMVLKEYRYSKELKNNVVAFVDDDFQKIGKKINGVKVVGNTKDIPRAVRAYKVDEIVIAMPSIPKKVIGNIVQICSSTHCNLKILPGIYEFIEGKLDAAKLREVRIEDLLGRDVVELDNEKISSYIEEKTVFVTGGGGSIGSELCRQIIRYYPKMLVICDIYENNAFEVNHQLNRIMSKLKNSNKKFETKVVIASIRDEKRIDNLFKEYKPDVVFHAAAHKHVPLMEESPKEAIKNNVFGTLNIVRSADKYNVDRFIQISTDKAVNPTNVMGATKRVCEMIMQAFNKVSKTKFAAVRFGNVLGSNGSVIPLFKEQIKNGGPVTVTHEEMERFFMTIPEASQLVLQAGSLCKGGEIFVLDMGKPVKIIELAEKLIKLSGYEPYEDIDIVISGLRPGEKLFEELTISNDNFDTTTHEKIFVEKMDGFTIDDINKKLEKLADIVKSNIDNDEVKEGISEVVSEYRPFNTVDS